MLLAMAEPNLRISSSEHGRSTKGTLMTTHDGSATKAPCWAVAGINLREVATRLRNKMCQKLFKLSSYLSATYMHKTINTLCIFHMLYVHIPQQDDRTSSLLQRLHEKTNGPAPGFEPTTFRIMSTCLGIVILIKICISRNDHFTPIGCQYFWGP